MSLWFVYQAVVLKTNQQLVEGVSMNIANLFSKLVMTLGILGFTTMANATLPDGAACRVAAGSIVCSPNYGFNCLCQQSYLVRTSDGHQYTQDYSGQAQGFNDGEGGNWHFWDPSNCHGAKKSLKANSEALLLPVCQ